MQTMYDISWDMYLQQQFEASGHPSDVANLVGFLGTLHILFSL